MRVAAHAPRSGVEKLCSDLLNGARAIAMRPAATIATVAVLGLGIGLVSAMFALADPFLLRPLPYARPNELVRIAISLKDGPRPAIVPTLADWQARTDLFADVGAYEISASLSPA